MHLIELMTEELAADCGSATIRRMWLPRFTLRWAFLIVTLCAFIALVAGQAVAGKEWAIAVIIALGGAAFFLVVYALFFLVLQAIPLFSPARPRRTTSVAANTSAPRTDETSR